MRVISLGSGSSGNALLVRAGETAVLVDAGFPQRILAGRLRQAGVAPEALAAILLTHEHSDHACGARELASRYGIPLVGDARTIAAALALRPRTTGAVIAAPERLELPVGRSLRLGALDVRSFPVPHDAIAPCGYLLSTAAWRVAIAIDAGMVTEPMLEALHPAHLVVLEANHDKDRLLHGPYPWHLKQRILGPTGHLSNEQASQALLRIVDDGPRWVWLAHLSRTNNTPHLARAQVGEYLRAQGIRHVAPLPLPREIGPVWDSAALLAPHQPARPDVAAVGIEAAELATPEADAAEPDAARTAITAPTRAAH